MSIWGPVIIGIIIAESILAKAYFVSTRRHRRTEQLEKVEKAKQELVEMIDNALEEDERR